MLWHVSMNRRIQLNIDLNRSFRFFISLLLLIQSPLFARVGMDLFLGSIFDDNTFRNYEQLDDRILQPQVTLYCTAADSRKGIKILYRGFFSYFQNYTDRQFQYHGAAANSWWNPGESSFFIYAGIDAGRRTNLSSYTYYNYDQWSGYLNLRIDESTTGNWRIGSDASARRYMYLPQFSYNEITGFIQKTYFFKTKTSLIGRVHLGYKIFTESKINEVVIQEITDTLESKGRGNGNSGNGNNGRGQGNNQNDGTTERDEEVITERTVLVEVPGERILQYSASLRVGQSIGAKTGCSIQGRITRHLNGEGRSLLYQDSGYEDDDYLFDDPYNFESDELLIEFTHVFPWTVTLKAGIDYRQKHYLLQLLDSNRDSTGGNTRQDKRRSCWVSIRKGFKIPSVFKSTFLAFSYMLLDNESSDAYFQYNNSIISLSWELKI